MIAESSPFTSHFNRTFHSLGWTHDISPNQAMSRWRTFEVDCRQGYPWDLEDYQNELTLRGTLKKAVPKLHQCDSTATADMVEQIEVIDQSLQALFTNLLSPTAADWWVRFTLPYASVSFCEQAGEAYGVHIRPSSKFDEDLLNLQQALADERNPTDAYIMARREGWYVTERPSLFYRCCTHALAMDRRKRQALRLWVHGKLPDEAFRAVFQSKPIQ
ncbi:hypothetical protein [Streptomyces sp. NPDC059788]|uniref:hypothetical protein n=1 Tax=Streptomyces sp. NPDC059788 TaxID=3346948 RepID=UPI003666CA99